MTKTLLVVTPNRDWFLPCAEVLQKSIPADIRWADSGEEALAAAKTAPPLLAIVDETLPDMTGLEFVRKLMMVNALVHTAISSDLPPEEFHEVSEGLGILTPLPLLPTAMDAEQIVACLRSVFAL